MLKFRTRAWTDGSGNTGFHYEQVDLGEVIESWLVQHCHSPWFREHHASFLTPEFHTWWINFTTLTPPPQDGEPAGHADYLQRMAYALYGWRSSRALLKAAL